MHASVASDMLPPLVLPLCQAAMMLMMDVSVPGVFPGVL